MSCPCQHEIPPIALSLALAVLLLWVSVMCSPLKAGFVCSHRSRSLGNLITRLKALSITQITHPACTSLCYADGFQWVCVRFQAHAASAYGRVSTGYPLSTNPGSPQRQQAGRRNIFWWFSLLTPVRWRYIWSVSITQRDFPWRKSKENQTFETSSPDYTLFITGGENTQKNSVFANKKASMFSKYAVGWMNKKKIALRLL